MWQAALFLWSKWILPHSTCSLSKAELLPSRWLTGLRDTQFGCLYNDAQMQRAELEGFLVDSVCRWTTIQGRLRVSSSIVMIRKPTVKSLQSSIKVSCLNAVLEQNSSLLQPFCWSKCVCLIEPFLTALLCTDVAVMGCEMLVMQWTIMLHFLRLIGVQCGQNYRLLCNYILPIFLPWL